MTMNTSRFSYADNLRSAGHYHGYCGNFWPPAVEYRLISLDLAMMAPPTPDGFVKTLETLRNLVEGEWFSCKIHGSATDPTRFRDPSPIADVMRGLAKYLTLTEDRRALEMRANAVESGWQSAELRAMTRIDETVAIVAGRISTWYGKQTGGLPTAFGCTTDSGQLSMVNAAMVRFEDIDLYMRRLHSHLRVGQVPAFMPANLFFMAGEGNRHPKHIAYFLPEDEGVKHSPFKKTYYFSNTHRALLDHISIPLAAVYIDLGCRARSSSAGFGPIPTLGVLAHEIGHFVHRPGCSYTALNKLDRWTSVVLQEICADVFGVLVLADLWADHLKLPMACVVEYYLAECLRYLDRGLGFFPDSDGMYLQLNYLVEIGALSLETNCGVHLQGDPDTILAGLRSLARVLADTLLAGEAERSIALYRTYGPEGSQALAPLLSVLAERPTTSIEYVQEYVRSTRPATPVT